MQKHNHLFPAKMARTPFIGGNWKCNGTKESVRKLVEILSTASIDSSAEVVVCPPYLHIPYVLSNISSRFFVGAQEASQYGFGAFTGAINSEMIKDFGLEWVIIGHSERRSLFGDDNELAAEKTIKALKAGLKVIFCFGESLDDRQSGKTNEVLEQQLLPLITKISSEDYSNIVLAYEPVWSIGTGVVCPTDKAQETHVFIRSLLKEKVSENVADSARIIYGGSVAAGNCVDLSAQPDIDGFLVGGASLKADFVTIINSKK
ncbi:hypothetical protein RCL1_008317 [Eukaryota sp. TZLM3-RCL]